MDTKGGEETCTPGVGVGVCVGVCVCVCVCVCVRACMRERESMFAMILPYTVNAEKLASKNLAFCQLTAKLPNFPCLRYTAHLSVSSRPLSVTLPFQLVNCALYTTPNSPGDRCR